MNNIDNENKWKYLLVYLYLKKYEDFNDTWNSFEDEIIQGNRFFLESNQKISDLIESCISHATYTLGKGEKLYRARYFTFSDYPDHLKKLNEYFKQLNKSDILIKMLNGTWNELLTPEINEIFENVYQDDFWGFNKEKYDAPPLDKATSGRANPEGISYLYTSENYKTAISELRPIFGQEISVAEIRIIKSLCLFDFTSTIQDINGKYLNEKIILNAINDKMSKPNYGNEMDYLPTQYICEMLKNKYNFDGIRFKSSLVENGNNIVLFNTSLNDKGDHENYVICKPSWYRIKRVVIEEDLIFPVSTEVMQDLEKCECRGN